jgi:hypothetical protein
VPKRQPKPEPITPEEVMDSPALRGYDGFLRFRPGAPAGVPPGSTLPTPIPPTGQKPIGELHTSVPVFRPPPRVRRAIRAEDGHSIGEQVLYEALWKEAARDSAESRVIRIGYGGMQSLCGLDKSNCKKNILVLIAKLSVELVDAFSVRRNEGNTYRIYAPDAILRRRHAAGMDWVVRSRGVRFVDPPVGL